MRLLRFTLLFLLLAAFGCDSATEAIDDGRRLVIVSGPDQTGGVGAPLAQPVQVRVTDADGTPRANTEVRWRTIEGGGSPDRDRTLTDDDGLTSVVWTLGTDAGDQSLLASSGNASITIRATGTFRMQSVAAGFNHSCALSTAGVAYCWGDNSSGQLGDGSAASQSQPVRVRTNVRFSKLTAGWSHTCGLSLAGEAYCWGDNAANQVGLGFFGSRSGPVLVQGTDAFVDLSAGFVHTCGVTIDGDVVCWGSNEQGQLTGTDALRARYSALEFRKVSAGEFHSCGILTDNRIFCWGRNDSGALGSIPAPIGEVFRTPTPVSVDLRFNDVEAGVRHTCAITTNNVAYCWGRNAVGETGQPPFVHASVPAPVPNGADLLQISTGNIHTCAVGNTRAACWGALLGNGTTSPSQTPVAIPQPAQFSQISAGFAHTCGVSNGEVWCWSAAAPTPARVPITP